MKRPTLALSLLIALYLVIAVIALWRTIDTQAMDLFSLGVLPVLIGLYLRASWAGVVLKVYIAIQTLGFTALATTGIIAYQITPEDVKVVFNGQELPLPLIAILVVSLLAFQWWVAFTASTKRYLSE
ncbi:hypothetical protein [Shewanella colwelliana]|uniref:Uncharacterized protein n=1 Tax=Shewanella colwelliana TaxID=23 RepID=A0A1E5IRT0_SHECO|nr:hypothetical protein [Shewanella colwelliana]MDX1279985.1 hypothetical protein [Shewanella colwelliana]OEG73251.1 hypothetical protein BEL05_13345 [Shewanella colwelliana]GIU38743.1 hypothetical protein TUM3794_11760 [Shewanella colwelliana]